MNRTFKLVNPCLAVIPALYLNSLPQNRRVLCFEDVPTKDMIRGEYENKIRFMSPPEKVFELFATIKDNEGLYMSYEDFMRAIIPFNYHAKQEEEEDNQKEKVKQYNSLLQYADINNDGKISIYEYFMVIRILQIVEKDLAQFCNQNNKLTQQMLIDFLDSNKSAFKLTIAKSILDPRVVKLNNDEYYETRKQMINKIFKSQEDMEINKFFQLRQNLFNEILDEEFNQFTQIEKKGVKYISNVNFAKSIICFLNHNKAHKYIKQIKKTKLPEELISLEEYKEFHNFINYNKNLMEEELEQSGIITRKNLKKMINQKFKQKRKISNAQINTFIQILDINGNGFIDCFEFAGIVETRNYFRQNQENQHVSNFWYDIPKKLNAWTSKIHRIWEIIQED